LYCPMCKNLVTKLSFNKENTIDTPTRDEINSIKVIGKVDFSASKFLV